MINDVSKTLTTTITNATNTIKTTKIIGTKQLIQENDKIITTTVRATTTTTMSLDDNCKGGASNRLNYKDDNVNSSDNNNFPLAVDRIENAQINDINDRDYKMTNSYEEQQSQENNKCLSLSMAEPMPSVKSTPSPLPSPSFHKDSSTSVLPMQIITREPTDAGREKTTSTTTKAALTVKPSLVVVELRNPATTLRHKNITNVPCKASYQRTVETETSTHPEYPQAQCELLEYNIEKDKIITKIPTTNNLQSLAERKALLKKEFFKDFPCEQKDLICSRFGLTKRLLKKQHNLKLKIQIAEAQPQNPEPTSLVALRKLNLEHKEEITLKSKKDQSRTLSSHSHFPSVKELAKRFDIERKMIVPQSKMTTDTEMMSLKPDSLDQRHSPLSDEGCNLGHSPYSSDDDNESIRTTHTAIERVPAKRKDKVARSASSDSALGLEVDESMDTSEHPTPQQQQKRRMTLTVTDLPLRPALLPVAEPTLLPDSTALDVNQTSGAMNQTQIPSKVLLEERVVEIPDDPRSGGSSRRESSQSCFSDFPASEMQGVRFVRTPSVVVSDYSDDIMCGITLEEIEYFRAQRMRRRRSSLDTSGTEKDALDNSSDVSASSSCSNLYYCGSTISALDGAECIVNGLRLQLERKVSDCSTCSASGDEDCQSPKFTIPEQPEDCQDLSDMLGNQHLSCKRSKKVGATSALLTVANSP